MRPTVVVLLLALAGCGGADPTRRAVEQIVEDLAVQEYGRASARYRQFEERILDESAASAWRRALDHGDPTVREWAVDALSRIGRPADVPRVREMLDDPFRKVQDAAAQGLVRMNPDVAREALLGRLVSDDPVDQAVAASVLGELGGAGVVDALLVALGDPDVEPGVRGIVAQALARAGDPRAAAHLAEVALDAAAPVELRRTAAEVLATLEGPGVESGLRSLLGADDAYVRDVARRALDQIAG